MALTPSQLDLLARCAISGYRTKEIAAHIGCGEQTVRNYLKCEDEQFTRIYQAYKQQAIQSVVDHNFMLRDHLPDAYATVGSNLRQDKDLRLRWETAKWLLENTTLTGHQPHQSVNVNVGIQNNVAGEQVAVAFGDLGKQFTELLGAVKNLRPTTERDPHEKVGDEALPASYKLLDTEPSPGAKSNGGGERGLEPKVPEGTPTEPTEPTE